MYNNNNANICKAHIISIRAESEAPKFAVFVVLYLLPFVYGEWKIFIIASYSEKLDSYAVAGSYWNVCERREREAVSQPAGCAVPWSRGAASVHDDIVNASKSHTTTDDGRTPPSVAITPHTASNLSLSLSLFPSCLAGFASALAGRISVFFRLCREYMTDDLASPLCLTLTF